MSSISSTSSSQGIMQFIQGLAGSSSSSAVVPTTTSSTTSTAASTSASTATSAGKSKGHHRHGGASGFEKLLQSVTNALQSAQASGSTTDPNKTIQSALEKIFKNGIAGNTAGTSATGATSTSTDAAATTDDVNEAKESFLNTLKSFGVTADQFQQDLSTAFQQANASGGQLNAATAFASFAPGSLVDTLA